MEDAEWDPDPGNVPKKISSERLFADYGKNIDEGEIRLKEPTKENKRVIDLYDPVDAMSMNREKNRVVVSGIRGVLQILKVRNHSEHDLFEGPSIVKDLDMRAYRKGKVNILYSAQNVKWNQLYCQYIATTSSNGSIVCWNIHRKNKVVFKAHERSATCVDWHATAPWMLVSGSRDCSVRSYDLRDKEHGQLIFQDKTCESVRDVAMCKAPGFDDYFFSGDDGGVLRLWDLRQPKRWVFQQVAHRSFVSTLSLNPNNRKLVASGGGRDKMVKIWDWSGPELKRFSVVETTAPLGRVAWRPDKPFQLATCASVNETTVHVWDVRRPYLPYVTYDEHRDSVTDACWPENTEFDVFISCGKDGLVVLHNIDSGHAPIQYACDVAFDITPDGVLGIATNSEIHAKNDADMEALAAVPAGQTAIKKIPYETFGKASRSLMSFGIPEALTFSISPMTFYSIAEKYLIGGDEIINLCEKNSKIARKANQEHVAQTWRLVEALCAQAKIQEEYDRLSKQEKQRIVRLWVIRKKELAEEGRRWLANLDDIRMDKIKRTIIERLENTQHVTAFLKFSSSSESDEEVSDAERIKREKKAAEEAKKAGGEKRAKTMKTKKKNASYLDFCFETKESNFKDSKIKKEQLHVNEFMGLRDEAYELRDDEKEAKFFNKARKQPTTAEEYELEWQQCEAEFKSWSPMLEIYRLLLYHAEQGDMQTCATISMVCGKRLFDAVDYYTVIGWIHCYMDMLHRLELHNVCAKIRKYCTLEAINSVSRENTTIQLTHADCAAVIVNGRCSKCEKACQPDCTVCGCPIIGSTYQCHVCGHAMHVNHAHEWFQQTNECAFVDCPCICGETTWPDMERTFLPNDDITRGHRKFNHVEQSNAPPVTRVDASRLDSDSEKEETIPDASKAEWSPTSKKLLKKYEGRTSPDKPWAKHLSKLYAYRCKRPPPPPKPKTPPLSPISQKELEREEVIDAIGYKNEWEGDEMKYQAGILTDGSDEAEEEPADLTYTNRFLIQQQVLREEEEKKAHAEKQFHLEQVDEGEEESEYDDDKADEEVNAIWGSKLYGDEYIQSLGFVGVTPDFYGNVSLPVTVPAPAAAASGSSSVSAEDEEEEGEDEEETESEESEKEDPNERVTSPTFLQTIAEVEERRRSRQSNLEKEDAESDDEEVKRQIEEEKQKQKELEMKELLTEKEGRVRGKEKKPKKKTLAEMTIKERVLAVLAMTREEKKRARAKARKKVYDASPAGEMLEFSNDEFDVSDNSDDSLLNTSDESSSAASTSSASELFAPVYNPTHDESIKGYKAESEEEGEEEEEAGDKKTSSSSTSHEELSAEPEENERIPTPIATGDLYEKAPSPVPDETVHVTKRWKKVSRSVLYSSSEEEADSPKYVAFIIEGVRPPSPSSSDASLSPPSPTHSWPSSHSGSPSPPPRSLVPLKVRKRVVFPPLPKKLLLPKFEASLPPLIEEVYQIVPKADPARRPIAETPPITSYANPFFAPSHRRKPVAIEVRVNGQRADAASQDISAFTGISNPLFGGAAFIRNSPGAGIGSFSSSGADKVAVNGINGLPLPQSNGSSEKLSRLPSVPEPKSMQTLYPFNEPDNGVDIDDRDRSDSDSDSSDMFCDSPPNRRPSQEYSAWEDGPFYPIVEGSPHPLPPIDPTFLQPREQHPWETPEQAAERKKKEQEEEEEAAAKAKEQEAEEQFEDEASDEEDPDGEKDDQKSPPTRKISPAESIFGRYQTPMMKELAKRKRELVMKSRTPKLPLSEPMKELKRVRFDETSRVQAMNKAVEKLKEIAAKTGTKVHLNVQSDREAEQMRTCPYQIKEEKMEKDYVNWLRNTADEGQLVYANSFSDPCVVFQLNHLDSYHTDVERAKRTAANFIEFIKLFYFIQWEDLLAPDSEFMLKEVYEMWDDYRKKRPLVCRRHYRDFQFRFFAASVATKIKQVWYSNESVQTKQEAIRYDWLHLKPCVVTIDDHPDILDGAIEPVTEEDPKWTMAEKKAANEYWDLFGRVPLHIKSVPKKPVAPVAEDHLEMEDASPSFWTKKMLRNVAYNSRKYDIKLSYKRTKKMDEDILRSNRETKTFVGELWKSRLEQMKNETLDFNFESSTLLLRRHERMVHTNDAHNPWPVCQFDDGKNYVTVRPVVTRRYIDLKSRIRTKFQLKKQFPLRVSRKEVPITRDDIRLTSSFRRFEPKLKKAEELKQMFSKHFKVVDRVEVRRRYILYPIIEEDKPTETILEVFEKTAREPEEYFQARRDYQDSKDLAKLVKMQETKYRKDLANVRRQESNKMKIMRKHWTPQMRKTIQKARRVLEIGRVLVEEDVQKWMEYRYEMTMAKRMFRKKNLLRKKEMKRQAPLKWHDAIDRLKLDEERPPPPYVKEMPKLKRRAKKPDIPNYNSSSDEDEDEEESEEEEEEEQEDEEEENRERELYEQEYSSEFAEHEDPDVRYEFSFSEPVDLKKVAAELQLEFQEKVERNFEANEDEWEYSDDSSVSTWFNEDCDDIVNRLINENYEDEHIILKERAKGALGQKLFFLREDREAPVVDSDDDEDVSGEFERDFIVKELESTEEECYDFDGVGDADGVRKRELMEQEHQLDRKRSQRKEFHRNEMQQIRFYLKAYALHNSQQIEPYSWDGRLADVIQTMHINELRRVSNRIHRKMKEEYEEMVNQDDIIADEVPEVENSLEFKMFHFLMFRDPGDSYEASEKKANELMKMLEPLKDYEMFFGKEGVVRLKKVGEEAIQSKNVRNSLVYMVRRFGGVDKQIPIDSMQNFLKLWWYNSNTSLEQFINCCEEAHSIDQQISKDLDRWKLLPKNLDIVKETVEQLEIGSVMNEMLFVVEMFVDETEMLFRGAETERDRIAFATMNIWDWHMMKYGMPEFKESPKRRRCRSESEISSHSEEKDVEEEQEGEQESEEGTEYSEVSEEPSPVVFRLSRFSRENSPEERWERRDSKKYGMPNQEMMRHYNEVYEKLKEAEIAKRQRNAEARAKSNIEKWERMEREQRWEVEEKERRVHDYLMMELALREKDPTRELRDAPEATSDASGNWRELLEEPDTANTDCLNPEMHIYAKRNVTRDTILEACGLPLTLDHTMFQAEMDFCQDVDESVSDASDARDEIEKDWISDEEVEMLTDGIDDDAQSYCSVKHVLRHELYFQREPEPRLIPSCVVIFTPYHFFGNPNDGDLEFKRWKRIIDGCECPYSFHQLVMRERLLRKCRDTFRNMMIDRYFEEEERSHSTIMAVFERCYVVVVVDNEMNPWTCRVVCRDSVSTPPHNRITSIRKRMVEESQKHLLEWINTCRIDMQVYNLCPVLVAREEALHLGHAQQFDSILIEPEVRKEWHLMSKHEGVCALDAMIRSRSTPPYRKPLLKEIFRPIYDAWFPTWNFWNKHNGGPTIVKRQVDEVAEYLHKTRLIINFCHQYYRMKRFDRFAIRDPNDSKAVDRAGVPSSSLFDILDKQVTKFCYQDSPHLEEKDRLVLKERLIKLATGKIKSFTINYDGAVISTSEKTVLANHDTDNDYKVGDGMMMMHLPRAEEPMKMSVDSLDGKDHVYIDVEDVETEINWLRSLFEDQDMYRRRWMAKMCFEIAQRALFRFSPNIADFERANKKFHHLLQLHGRQRPLLDMMLTRVRGTYFMPLRTNMALYDAKLITFGELVDSELLPEEWADREETLEENRQQEPKDPDMLNAFLLGELFDEESEEEDSSSETESDASIHGSTESLNSESKIGKEARKTADKVQRDLDVGSMRSKPDDPDEMFAIEKRALGPARWKTRRRLNDVLEGVADLDREKIEAKLPEKKKYLLKYIQKLIVENCDTAHWSWGELKMQTKRGRIPPPHLLKPRHIAKIKAGEKKYKPFKKAKPGEVRKSLEELLAATRD